MSTLDEYLAGWTMTASPIDSRTDKAGAWAKGNPLHFRVAIDASGLGAWMGEYSAGEGIATAAAVAELDAGSRAWRTMRRRMSMSGGMGGRWSQVVRRLGGRHWATGRTLDETRALDVIREWYRPALADVVGALFCDASGMGEFADLRQWVDETGFEFSHPADALDTFEACRTAARFLNSALGAQYDAAAEVAAEM